LSIQHFFSFSATNPFSSLSLSLSLTLALLPFQNLGVNKYENDLKIYYKANHKKLLVVGS